MRFACVSITALGSPVVPDVNTRDANVILPDGWSLLCTKKSTDKMYRDVTWIIYAIHRFSIANGKG